MTNPVVYFRALDATWPAAAFEMRNGWLLRKGAGGGKRVSAASLLREDAELISAESYMRSWNQVPLFQLTAHNQALDKALAAQGYVQVDPVTIYSAPVASLLDNSPETARIVRLSSPIALTKEIWAEGGIGQERIEVMRRVKVPREWLMARIDDKPAAVGFVAVANAIAMVHAVETRHIMRRQGAARMIINGAARFASDKGARELALAVTCANAPANQLYQKLGMTPVAAYHYRIYPEATQ